MKPKFHEWMAMVTDEELRDGWRVHQKTFQDKDAPEAEPEDHQTSLEYAFIKALDWQEREE